MVTLLKPKAGGRPIVVDKPILLIGRNSDCDIIIESSAKISRQHCCVSRVDDRCIVRDLESMNGVWVNGERVTVSTDLFPGDELMIGDVRFDVITNAPVAAKSRQPVAPARSTPAPRREEVVDANSEFMDAADMTASNGNEVVKFSPDFELPTSGIGSDNDLLVPLSDLDCLERGSDH